MSFFSKHTIAAILLTGTAFAAHAGSELPGAMPYDRFLVTFAYLLHANALVVTAAVLFVIGGVFHAAWRDTISFRQAGYGIGTILLAGFAVSLWMSQVLEATAVKTSLG